MRSFTLGDRYKMAIIFGIHISAKDKSMIPITTSTVAMADNMILPK